MDVQILVKQRAIDHILKIVPEDYAGIRIKLVPNGCAGWTHRFELCDEPNEGDFIVPLINDISIIMDRSTKAFIANSVIDYVKNGLSEELVIDNPNVKVCGCGKSFSK